MSDSFVYKWINVSNGMFYIGKHKGFEDDGYISSGKYFLSVYWANPKIFIREILHRGSEKECLKIEAQLIHTAINTHGYDHIYNLTSFSRISQWSRTCLVCGAKCCPENERWAAAFELVHFNNCLEAPRETVPKVKHVRQPRVPKVKPEPRVKRKKKVFESIIGTGHIYSRWVKKYGLGP